jgi:hypothetical protein
MRPVCVLACPPAGDGDDGLDPAEPALGRAPGRADLAYNLVVNLVESVGSQGGAAGPATNLLGGLQVPVPPEWHMAGREQ